MAIHSRIRLLLALKLRWESVPIIHKASESREPRLLKITCQVPYNPHNRNEKEFGEILLPKGIKAKKTFTQYSRNPKVHKDHKVLKFGS